MLATHNSSTLISNVLLNVSLAWQFYRQEYNLPHQRLLRWTQAILLIFMLALSQSSQSIQQYLTHNLQGLLGADALISQYQTLDAQQLAALTEKVDDVVATQQIKVNFSHQESWQYISLKGVSDNYPLQGELLTTSVIDGSVKANVSGPKAGEIWFDNRLYARFDLKIGDVVSISSHEFILTKLLSHEPDQLMEGHNVDMRAMINIADMRKLNFSDNLIQYRYLLAFDSSKLSALHQWQKRTLPAADFIHKKGNHPLALFWQRTENFLGLTSILLFFMAAVAIEQLSIKHKSKERYFSAVCMSLGATNRTGIVVSIIKWCCSFLLLLPAALIIAAISHWVIISYLADSFPNLQWQWHIGLSVKTVAFVSMLFALFYLPVWYSLVNSSVGSLFTKASNEANQWTQKLAALFVLCIVVFAYSDNGLLTAMMLAAMGVTILLILLMSWFTLTLGEKITQNLSGLLPFVFFMMKQRLISKSTQILGVGLSAFLLLFTLMLMHDLGKTMASYQRTHDGNLMVSQATTQQMQYVNQWADKNNITVRQQKSYMHAKLIEINQQSLNDFTDKPSDSLAHFSREIRMHWNNELPSNNKITSGKWWQPGTQNWQQVSLEEEVMTDMGLSLGDELGFIIAGKRYNFILTASHAFKSGNGSITFWVQVPQAALSQFTATHYAMASLEISDTQQTLLSELWHKFPTLRMVSLKEMTSRFDTLLAMITTVITGFSTVIILLAGIVILASINAVEAKERKKKSIIMSFGFSRATCFRLNIIEWLITAVISAGGAIVGTYLAGLLIYQSQFSLPYKPDFIWLFITLFIILASVTSLGILASKRSLQGSVRQLMAE
jgi:predicted lysophospholipase L1 biosynthesis ABC-type transport system permease subunit